MIDTSEGLALLRTRLPEFWEELPDWIGPSEQHDFYPVLSYLFDYSRKRYSDEGDIDFPKRLFSLIELLLADGTSTVVDAVSIELLHPVSAAEYGLASWPHMFGPLARAEYEQYISGSR